MGEDREDNKHGESTQIAGAGQNREARDTPAGEHHANPEHDPSHKDCGNRQIAFKQTVRAKRDVTCHGQQLRDQHCGSQGDHPDPPCGLGPVSRAHNGASEAKLEMLRNCAEQRAKDQCQDQRRLCRVQVLKTELFKHIQHLSLFDPPLPLKPKGCKCA